MKNKILLTLLVLLLSFTAGMAQTGGKIAGTITDAGTGEALIGVNVMLEGTNYGAATDVDGYYVILNVPPGNYNIKASYIGYTPSTVQNARVNIDQTTLVDIQMRGEDIAMDEIVVVAQEPVVQQDVASSRANITAEEIEALPTTDVNTAVGLQAGVTYGSDGPVIRGGTARETAYIVNGMTMRDERDNTPYTNISMTAVEDIQVQTGGFSAEYGNIRSGIVNVVTKEGSKDIYSFKFIGRYTAPQAKHFGSAPNDPSSYYMRPYLDNDVAWTGTTNGVWDEFMQDQYPEFVGWNEISSNLLADDDPTNDLTPREAQELFLWQHRRQLQIDKPDYELDMSLSGPVPFVSKQLGGLRFAASFRKDREMYIIPLSRESYQEYSGTLKLTTDLSSSMKLMVQGLYGKEWGTNDNNTGNAGLFRSASSIAGEMDRVSYIETRIFAPDYWAPSEIIRDQQGAKLTHVLNPTTFYEAQFSRFASHYSTNPGALRDSTLIKEFGDGYWVNEAPFGFVPNPTNEYDRTGINGMRMAVGMSNSRDSSFAAVYTAKFDITSQINKFNEVKAGFEINYTDNRTNYASVDEYLPSGRTKSKWNTTPVRGGLYVQDKLEFEGMIANLGVRIDYLDPGGEWYVYDSYTQAFSSQFSAGIDTLLAKEATEKQIDISPRVAIAFPISVNSKLFFNYGHQRTIPTPENLYLIRRYTDNNAVTRLANPNAPLEKSVQYELGYEHNLFDQFLLRLAGYYKDVSLVSYLVDYQNDAGDVNYSVTKPNAYSDTRGFEATISKNRGPWIQGFINYTYEVSTSGHFGFGTYFENRTQQSQYERESRDAYQEKPIPRPYARANINFFTPSDFGPEFGGIHILGDWAINLLGSWRNGYYLTWAGGGAAPGIQYNVQWKDSYNVDMRFSKSFRFSGLKLELFADISNLFNHKYMTSYGFVDGADYISYMNSLHLPGDVQSEYTGSYIPGDDQPGDYRRGGTYQPMLPTADASKMGESSIRDNVIYYEMSSGRYLRYADGQWSDVPQAEIDDVLENKRYIDMPNQDFFTFLNPRNIYWGLKFTVDL